MSFNLFKKKSSKDNAVELSQNDLIKTQAETDKDIILMLSGILIRYPEIKKELAREFATRIYHNNFNKSNVLTADDKKALNLTVRRAYPVDFIGYFDVDKFSFDPLQFTKNNLNTARSIVASSDEIARLKKSNVGVKKIKTSGIGTWDNKIYPISNIPAPQPPDYRDPKQEQVLFYVTPVIE